MHGIITQTPCDSKTSSVSVFGLVLEPTIDHGVDVGDGADVRVDDAVADIDDGQKPMETDLEQAESYANPSESATNTEEFAAAEESQL